MATDPRGIITDVNKQTEALTGCTRDELIGAPFKNYFTDSVRAEAGINRVLTEGKVTNYELTARARDGTETIVSYNATTFHDRDRMLQGVFAAEGDRFTTKAVRSCAADREQRCQQQRHRHRPRQTEGNKSHHERFERIADQDAEHERNQHSLAPPQRSDNRESRDDLC